GPMRAFAGPVRTPGVVEPAPADLAESVHPPLGRSSAIVRVPPPPAEVLTALQRGEHHLAGLRVEVSIHPHHAEHRGRDLQPPLLAQALRVLEPLAPVELLA